MIRPLRLGPLQDIKASQLIPPIMQPLATAARRGEDVAAIALAIVHSLGFEGFWYGVSLSLRPRQEARTFLYSTWPEELPQIYDERAYIEVDPRLEESMASAIPVVWDQPVYRGRSAKVDEFLDALRSFKVASGVMCGLRDHRGAIAALSLGSSIPVMDEVRRMMVMRNMGEILAFQRYFHELFVSGVLNELIPPVFEGRRLTERELQCLTMAARGLTSDDIAVKLKISPRTVQNHMDALRSKLGAANRQEAIFIASRRGYLTA